MGGKSGAKIKITRYYMSSMWGLSVAADEVKGLYYGEKAMWEGNVGANTTIPINNPNLFGGDKKEGGVAGSVFVMFGRPDQVMPNILAQKLGYASGAVAPAYRGITSIFLGGSGAANWKRGFYWAANSPYLKDLWARVTRYSPQLNSTNYKIPRDVTSGGTGETPVLQVLVPPGSSGWKWRTATNVGGLEETFGGDPSSPTFDDSSFASAELPLAATDPGAGRQGWPLTSVTWPGGIGQLMPVPSAYYPGTWVVIRHRISVSKVGVGVTVYIRAYPSDFSGVQAWVNGTPCTAVNPTEATPTGSYFGLGASSPAAGEIVVTIAVLVQQGDSTGPADEFKPQAIDATIFALDVKSSVSSWDSNPAHIIYECLTNTEWGLGEDPSNIDAASFNVAAQTLYDETLGLSMLWTAESSIEDFVNEVLQHINGVLFTNPRTGLFTLRLARGDYNVDDLREINPDNAQLSQFSRKAWGETVNEVKVTWTNPANEQQETVVVQDNGNMAMQGALVSSTSNYYGVRRSDLALILAARDLRASSTPLCIAELTLDRSFWDVVPMDVLKLRWPDLGIAQLVMRVTKVTYSADTVNVELLQDIFSLPAAQFEVPPTSSWEDPNVAPVPVTTAMVMPMPYAGLGAALEADVSTIEDPATYVTVLAAQPAAGGSSYDLYGETPQPNGSLAWTALDYTRAFLQHATSAAGMVAEPISTLPALATGQMFPDENDLIVIGGPATPREQLELALVAEVDPDTGAATLWRGVLDTIPRSWPAGTDLWCGRLEDFDPDLTLRSDGETVDYKLLTNTTLGQLSLDNAPVLAGTALARPSKPLRPANPKINGQGFGQVQMSPGDTTAALTWSTRNRLTEEQQILKWTDGSVPAEAGATVTLIISDLTGAEVDRIEGLTGSSYALSIASYASTLAGIRVGFAGQRGEEVSWNAHTIDLLFPPPENSRLTEDGTTRLLEDGTTRLLEDGAHCILES